VSEKLLRTPEKKTQIHRNTATATAGLYKSIMFYV